MKNVSDEYCSASILFTRGHSSGTLVNKPSEINSNINFLDLCLRPCKEPAFIHPPVISHNLNLNCYVEFGNILSLI